MTTTTLAVALLLLAAAAQADLYMHNPRGSNNRCDESSNNRENANRLFDSQNNAAGGYAWAPPMYYYEGSELTIEWTQQHTCGQDKNHCELIFQYGCDSTGEDELTDDKKKELEEEGLKRFPGLIGLKDGTPDNLTPTGNNAGTCTGDIDENNQDNVNRGRHETFAYYDECETRERNKGLFTADQNPNNNIGARATRQNPGGTKNGFECPEERDYYRSFIHFQWTGSNFNPTGNAGEGRNKWDRSNIVQLASPLHSYPMEFSNQSLFDADEKPPEGRDDTWSSLAFQAAFIDQNMETCKTLSNLKTDNDDQAETNCAKLNGRQDGYMDMGAVKMNNTGTYYYMSSRNNNFTNRGQKGTIVVKKKKKDNNTAATIGIVVGVVAVAGMAAAGAYKASSSAATSNMV